MCGGGGGGQWAGSAEVSLTQKISKDGTHGSGECMGAEEWRMYCVHWNTLKARLLRKSRADSRPATGRSWKPVFSGRSRDASVSVQALWNGDGGECRRSFLLSTLAAVVSTLS